MSSKLLTTIKIPIIDLIYQKIIKITTSELRLYDTHFIIFRDFLADEVDGEEVEKAELPEDAWTWEKDVKNYLYTTFKRSELIGTEINRLTTCYKLSLFMLSGRRIETYSKNKALLHSINIILTEYILGNDEKVIPDIKDILRTEQESS